ncbi:MAG: hypothetical protein RMI91_15270 [Gemmatales bacterium]|nr:hypothetical protein [Gemmatales bacterium]
MLRPDRPADDNAETTIALGGEIKLKPQGDDIACFGTCVENTKNTA